jgi:hypothetical protein
MDAGFYITSFRTPLDDASGVIVVDGDRVRGGDSGMYYVGEVTGSGTAIKVRLRVRQHDKSKQSVFGDVDDFTLTLNGKRQGDQYVFEGRADRASSLKFQAILMRVPEQD